MTTYNTQNPLGSADPRDLYDNAENADRLINGEGSGYADRLGNERLSWAGMEQAFQEFLLESGYQDIGDYAAGLEITARNQIFLRSGEYYRAGAALGLPYTTTGDWATEGDSFVSVGDAALRQELAAGTALTNSSTGEQALSVALDDRVIHKRTVADLQALDTSKLVDGQQALIYGVGSYMWDAAALDWVFSRPLRTTHPSEHGGDLAAAMVFAATNQYQLLTGPETYEIDTDIQCPDGLVWRHEKTHVLQTNTGMTTPGLRVGNDNAWSGHLIVEMVDAPGGLGTRVPVVAGNYNTGLGVSGWEFGTIEIRGGHSNMNGVSVYGDTNNVRGKHIFCGDSDKIGRVFLAHWGNTDDHYHEGGVYQHVTGYGPTTHPHDIKIDEISSGFLNVDFGDFAAVAAVSAGYDIEISSVSGRVSNATGAANVLLLTAGDLGFAYASESDKSVRMRGVNIHSVNGESNKLGISRIGKALYWDADSGNAAEDDFYAWIKDTYETVDLRGGGNTTHSGVQSGNGRGSTYIGKLLTDNFASAYEMTDNSRDTYIGLLSAKNCQNSSIRVFGTGEDQDAYPRGLHIGTLISDGTGAGGLGGPREQGFQFTKAVGMRIDNHIIRSVGTTNGTAAGTFGPQCLGVSVGSATIIDTAYSSPFVYDNSAEDTSSISVGVVHSLSSSGGRTPINGGVAKRASGRVNEYQIFGVVPAGLRVNTGDRFWSTNAASGSPLLTIVTGGGVTGSTATTSTRLTYP